MCYNKLVYSNIAYWNTNKNVLLRELVTLFSTYSNTNWCYYIPALQQCPCQVKDLNPSDMFHYNKPNQLIYDHFTCTPCLTTVKYWQGQHLLHWVLVGGIIINTFCPSSYCLAYPKTLDFWFAATTPSNVVPLSCWHKGNCFKSKQHCV